MGVRGKQLLNYRNPKIIYQREPNETGKINLERKKKKEIKSKEMKNKWESMDMEMYVEGWIDRKKRWFKRSTLSIYSYNVKLSRNS